VRINCLKSFNIYIEALWDGTKEWGFFCTYHLYITVFIRNAANLTLLLLKGSTLKKGNKNEILVYTVPLGPLKIYDF
jgi:hypothetical protein